MLVLKPLGHERIDKEGYVWIKYKDERKASSNYELKHRIIWMNINGLIPKGYNIIFLDGDRMNFTLENLQLVSNKDNMTRNFMSDQAIAKKFIGESKSSKDIMPLIKMKRAELLLNKKIREHVNENK
ncbi:HNH endonuclease signature motif containing protein [Myroides odoratus]|uniref:HNH endonuclease signature motif containing protein n=1 Tax=Myroides odoratus TaxID=256 RepID=UPI0039AF6AD8